MYPPPILTPLGVLKIPFDMFGFILAFGAVCSAANPASQATSYFLSPSLRFINIVAHRAALLCLPLVALDNPTGYTTQHVNLNLTSVTSGRLHSAIIEGLEPSTTFYYACGDEDLGLSTAREFRTPGYVRPTQAVTFGILADLGQTNDSA